MKSFIKLLFVTSVCFSANIYANIFIEDHCERSDINTVVGKDNHIKFLKGSDVLPYIYPWSGWKDGQVRLIKGNLYLINKTVHDGHEAPFDYKFSEAGTYLATYEHEYCYSEPHFCVSQVYCRRTINVVNRTKPSISSRTHSGNSNTHSMDHDFTTTFEITDSGKDLTSFKIYNGTSAKTCAISNSSKVNTCSYTLSKSDMTAKQYTFSVKAIDNLGDEVSGSFKVTMQEANTPPTVTLSVNNTKGALSVSSAPTVNVKYGDQVAAVITASDINDASGNQLSDLELNAGNGWESAKTFFGNNTHAYNNACQIGGNSANCTIPLTIYSDTTIQARARDKADAVSTIKAVKVNGVVPPVPHISASNTAPFVGDVITLTATVDSAADLADYHLCAFNVTGINADNGCSSALAQCAHSDKPCTKSVSSTSAGTRIYTVYAKKILGDPKGHAVTVNFQNHYGVVFTNPRQKNYDVGDKVVFRAKASSLGAQSTHITKLELFEGSDATGRKLSGVSVSPALPIALEKGESKAKNIIVQWTTTSADVGYNKTYTLVATDNKNNKARTSLTGVSIESPVPNTPSIAQISVTKESADNGQYLATISGLSNTRRIHYKVFIDGQVVTNQTNVNVTQTSYSFSIHTQVPHHGKALFVEAFAENYNNSNPNDVVSSQTKYSNSVNIENFEMAPHSPVFDDLPSQVGGAYAVQWQANTDGVTTQYKLHSWPGLPSDKPNSELTQHALPALLSTSFQVNAPSLGRYTYQITACNSQNKCTIGQQVTIEHIAPFFSAGEIQPCTIDALDSGQTSFQLTAQGVGFTPNKTLYVRVRKTGETFSFPATVLGNTISAEVNERACRGYLNGGLALTLFNGVKNASKGLKDTLVIDNTGSEVRPELSSEAFTVSENHYLYVGETDGLRAYKLNTSTGLVDVWKHQFEAALSNAIVAKPLVMSNNAVDEIYVGSLNHRFYKLTHDPLQAELNKRKVLNWVLQTQGPIRAQAGIDTQQNLYVGSMDEALYSVSTETGHVQWHYAFPKSGGIVLQPTVSGSGHIYVTTQDGELHVIDNRMIGANAIKWQDVSSLASAYAQELKAWELAQWQPDQSHTDVIGLAKAMYVLLQRAPTKNELSFLAYLLANEHPYNEIISVLINANPDLANASNAQFIERLFYYLLGEASSTVVLSGGELGSGNQAYWVSVLESGGHPRRCDNGTVRACTHAI
ncbi:PQQ-binding-like beta-propeller repeat protein [Pseudoalteromonas luteoviolacea]|uniref:outer membrane protein assembly factor BamB family protein n=1 Tax=Pseudoalteromonas luteoviolacea TaxID=43657 RepID=UPI001F1927DE|nr:PQQ-binding-like beta-propeller repeat protein [Pseudoalteromonas luteoviolacea]MCF6439722.1 PQQ-binding-like beta-propeller repeat protein [Pseudoalteromonas luteoviolacea]